MKYSNVLFNVIQFTIIIGYSLCLGSIASFIAMNIAAGSVPNTTFIYWQRLFVSPISRYVTVPGIWLLLFATICFYILFRKEKKAIFFLLLVAALIFINGQFIIAPMAKTVSALAIAQLQTDHLLLTYKEKKMIEDTCGGINLLLLLVFLVIYIRTVMSIWHRNSLLAKQA